MSKTAAGPPPFTVTCEPPSPNHRPPSYEEVTRSSEEWANPAVTEPWGGPTAATVVPQQSQHRVYPTVPREDLPPTQEGYQTAPTVLPPYQQVYNQNTPPTTQQPPQQGYANMQADRSATVVYVNQPPQVIVGNIALPNGPARLTCPSCRQVIQSRVEHKAATKTHLWAFVLFIFGCWPCCLFPYCMDSCQNANHYCTNCGAYIGSAFN